MSEALEDDATPETGRTHRGGEDGDAAAIRLRIEMRDAVTALRSDLRKAFPRWQRRRAEVARDAAGDADG